MAGSEGFFSSLLDGLQLALHDHRRLVRSLYSTDLVREGGEPAKFGYFEY